MTQPSPDGSAWPTAATEDRPDAAYPDAAPDPAPAAGPPEWPPRGAWPAGTPQPSAAYATPHATTHAAAHEQSPYGYDSRPPGWEQDAWERDAWERAQQPGPWAPPEGPGPWAPPEEPAYPQYDRYAALHETAAAHETALREHGPGPEAYGPAPGGHPAGPEAYETDWRTQETGTFLTWAGADDQTAQFPPVRDDGTVEGEAIGGEAVESEAVEGEVVWHQQPPGAPFRAKHEKPGEWQTEPPEHLAFEHSPPAEVQPGVQDEPPDEAIPLSMLPQPWQVPFDPQHTEPHPDQEAARPARGRTGRWVALAAALTVLLLGGGAASAYLLLRDAESGRGSPDPATAVDRFMTEVYTRHDAAAAEDLVCREARDPAKIAGRVSQIEAYATEYPAPSYVWEQPAVSANTGAKATVDVQLTMTTDDERAARQQLTFTVVRKTGWLVCDVTSRA